MGKHGKGKGRRDRGRVGGRDQHPGTKDFSGFFSKILESLAGSKGEGGVGGREGSAVQEPREGLTEGMVLEEEEGGMEGVWLAFCCRG
eukprot:evm.model.NODE_24028_length_1838_cov_29.108814.1